MPPSSSLKAKWPLRLQKGESYQTLTLLIFSCLIALSLPGRVSSRASAIFNFCFPSLEPYHLLSQQPPGPKPQSQSHSSYPHLPFIHPANTSSLPLRTRRNVGAYASDLRQDHGRTAGPLKLSNTASSPGPHAVPVSGPATTTKTWTSPDPAATQHSRQPHGMERSCTHDERQPASHALQLRTAEPGIGQWAPPGNVRPGPWRSPHGTWHPRRLAAPEKSVRGLQHGHLETNTRRLCISQTPVLGWSTDELQTMALKWHSDIFKPVSTSI